MTIKIAIADDHKVFLNSLTALLNRIENLQVILQVENGADLVTRISPAAFPDVVLLDLEMKGLDGLGTIEQLRAQHQDDIKILVLSMHEEPKLVEEVLAKGANGYIPKTADTETLVSAIRQVHSSGFYLQPSFAQRFIKQQVSPSTKDNSEKNDQLSEREIEVLKLICEELTTNEIAERINLTTHTVNVYRKNLIAKTGSKNIAGLVIYAIKQGYYVVPK